MPKSPAQGRRTSTSQEDYLKAMFELGGSTDVVPTSRLAHELNVTAASTSEMYVKLAALDLIVHDAGRGARLTLSGRALALEMVRHHRLLETYLVHALGYSWDEVHEEADRLEHSISERLEARMAAALGEPEIDPHGDPIPSQDGRLAARGSRPLTSCGRGERVVLERVSDRDPDKLRAISALGLIPGAVLEVMADSRWEGPIELQVAGASIQIPLGLARALFVEE